MRKPDEPAPRPPHVVIVGAGFGGLSAAKALARAAVKVTLIDRRNHHVFQPLLYQVAAAALSPNQVATPVRTIVRTQQNTEVLLGEVTGIEPTRREVRLGSRRIAYDYLVLATGARHSYFGRDEWEKFAPGLKSVEDALELRRRILLAFERAELEDDDAERARLMTFVIVGGGATGVELAGSIAELAKKALVRDFRNINPQDARIVLVEAGPRLLGAFPPDLSDYAAASLVRLGAELRLGQAVTACDADGVTLDGERIETRCVIWAAGVAASPAAAWLGAAADRAGRVIVEPDLTIPGDRRVFVIGDCAHARGHDGAPLPGLAPVAKQEGKFVARAIAADLSARARGAFVYKNYGALATVGRKSAVAVFDSIKLRGFIGWIVWSVAHIYYLIGFRNRIVVAMDWMWSYLTFERGARLITGALDTPRQTAPVEPGA